MKNFLVIFSIFAIVGLLIIPGCADDDSVITSSEGLTEGPKNLTPSSDPKLLTPLGNLLFFKASATNTSRHRLWVTDGTEEGTQPHLGDENPFVKAVIQIGLFADKLIIYSTNFDDMVGVFVTDTSLTNATRVIEGSGVGNSRGFRFVEGQTKLYVVDGDRNLMVTDGVNLATLLKNFTYDDTFQTQEDEGLKSTITETVQGSAFGVLGDTLYFSASYLHETTGVEDIDPWISDGSVSGTKRLIDLAGNSNASYPYSPTNYFPFEGRMYFTNNNAIMGETWSADGTTDVQKISSSPSSCFLKDTNRVFIAANTVYIKILESGTIQSLATVGVGELCGAALLNGKIYFNGYDPYDNINGSEPWVLNVTSSEKMELANINPSGGSQPTSFVALGSKVYFAADIGNDNYRLFVTDGTPAGTGQLYPDLELTGGEWRFINNQWKREFIVPMGGKLYFTADDGVYGNELWQSDGTQAGTRLLKDIAL